MRGVTPVCIQHKPNAHWDCVGGGNTPTVPKTPAPPLCWWCLATHSDLCVKNVGVSALRRVFDCNPTASPGTTATLLRRSELLRRTGYCSPTASPGTATLYLYSRSSSRVWLIYTRGHRVGYGLFILEVIEVVLVLAGWVWSVHGGDLSVHRVYARG